MTFRPVQLDGIENLLDPGQLLRELQRRCLEHLAGAGIGWDDIINAYRMEVVDGRYLTFEPGPAPLYDLPAHQDMAVRLALLADEWQRHNPTSRPAATVAAELRRLQQHLPKEAQLADARGNRKDKVGPLRHAIRRLAQLVGRDFGRVLREIEKESSAGEWSEVLEDLRASASDPIAIRFDANDEEAERVDYTIVKTGTEKSATYKTIRNILTEKTF